MLANEGRIEACSQSATECIDADIPRDMALQIGVGDTKRAERKRDPVAAVIPNQQKRRTAIRIDDVDHHQRGFKLIAITYFL